MAAHVEIALSQTENKVDAGGTAAFGVTIRNRGTVVDQYTLTIEGLDVTWWEATPSTVSLFPGDEATATFNLHPPVGALAGTHPFLARAVSVDDASRAAEAEAVLFVAPAGELLLGLEPSLATGLSGRYTAQLTNRTNAPASFTLSGRDPGEELIYEIQPPILAVPAYGDASASVLVRPRTSHTVGMPRSYQFSVRAVPEGEEEPAAEAQASLEYRPRLRPISLPTGRWRWLLALIPLLALALLIRSLQQPGAEATPTPTVAPTKAAVVAPPPDGGGAKVPAPTISSFELLPGRPGFALSWKVEGADTVELNGNKVDATGKQMVDASKDQGFELKATNKGGTVVKRINALVFPPPVITSFSADPPAVYQGQPSVLRWEVTGAERAKVGGQDGKIPRGWLEVRPESTRDYVLTAENGVGWVVQKVSVKVIGGPPPAAAPQGFRYDFKEGTEDWELGTGVWSRVPWEGGYALRGEGHGFARLTAHSGEVTSLVFRFLLEDANSTLQANVLEGVDDPHRRYSVSIGQQGVGIQRLEGTSTQDLGRAPGAVAVKAVHEARILAGGGSIDVFLDGKPVVGADDPGLPPPGYVSFESQDRSVVYVQDVAVQMGPESSPYPRAPRAQR